MGLQISEWIAEGKTDNPFAEIKFPEPATVPPIVFAVTRRVCLALQRKDYPEAIGHPQHDIPKRRAIAKGDYELLAGLKVYGAVMLENGGYIAQDGRPRLGNVLLGGFQYTF